MYPKKTDQTRNNNFESFENGSQLRNLKNSSILTIMI